MQQAQSNSVAPPDMAVQQSDGTPSWAKAASIGVNIRVTGHCQQGGRKYMEDYFAVAYQHTHDEKDLEYAYFGIFDGHGGAEAAAFAKEHLMEYIVRNPRFWYHEDEEVLESIKDGFMDIHHRMWKIHDKWPKTASGLPSTAGTTASIAFIRRGKIYVGHVGDSGITLGYQRPGCADWQAKSLTKDHKPESEAELARIEQSGGKVVMKMGVPRVVWNRPRIGHKGPVRRSTPIDEIPFLAVARSLGDLWSYNASNGEFVVSPKPDVSVHKIDTATFRCLIFGTDGLYNMLTPQMAVHYVQEAERRNEEATLTSPHPHWINPSRTLVERALDRWCSTKMRADNTSVITLMLDPPGPPRAQVLRTKRMEREKERERLRLISEEKDTETPTPAPIDPPALDPPKIKPRESTAFDTRLPYPESDTDTSTSTGTGAGAESETETETPCDSEHPPAPPSVSTPQKENDIQINEVTSSMDCHLDDAKRKKRTTKKLNIIQRKFNLRSNNTQQTQETAASNKKTQKNAAAKMPAPTLSVPSTRSTRAPLGENTAHTSRLNVSLGESRVLRERRNTTPNGNANVSADNSNANLGQNSAAGTKKSKSLAKKMTISTEKKKLLQNLLFKKDSHGKTSESTSAKPPPPKTKENHAKTPPKVASLVTPLHEHITRSSATRRTSERHKAAALATAASENKQDAPTLRVMRKSTLKLRMHEGIFKAKLRAHSKIKLKRKAKGLSLKSYVGS